MTSTSPSLLTLPPELRIKIYQFSSLTQRTIHLCFSIRDDDNNTITMRPAPERQPPLSMVCRQLREEVLSVYYGENQIVIFARRPLDLLFRLTHPPQWVSGSWETVAKYAKSVVIYSMAPNEKQESRPPLKLASSGEHDVTANQGSGPVYKGCNCWATVKRQAAHISSNKVLGGKRTACGAMAEWVLHEMFSSNCMSRHFTGCPLLEEDIEKILNPPPVWMQTQIVCCLPASVPVSNWPPARVSQ